MSYRLVVVGIDSAMLWWQTELLYTSLRRCHNPDEANMTRVITLSDSSPAYSYSCDTFITKTYHDPYNLNTLPANRCLGFRDYMRDAEISEDYVILLDADTLVTQSLFDIPFFRDGDILTGYTRRMVTDAHDRAKKFVYSHLSANHYKADCGADNMYVAKTGTMSVLAQLYGDKAEKILQDQEGMAQVGKTWDKWAMILAMVKSGFQLRTKGKGLQWLATENTPAPILHYRNLPDTKHGRSFDQRGYVPWSETDIEADQYVFEGQRIFFQSLNAKAKHEEYAIIDITKSVNRPVIAKKSKDKIHVLNNVWLFSHIVTNRKQSTGWILMCGPVRNKKEEAEFDKLRQEGYRFIAICSLKDWPRTAQTSPEWEHTYKEVCEGWLHPFRSPDDFLPDDKLPRDLLSISDFISPSAFNKYLNMPKERDFIAVSSDNEWAATAKGWNLANKVIPVLCNELGLKGTLIGRSNLLELPECKNLTIEQSRLLHPDFMKKVSSSKFLLCTSQEDASPRMITETLSVDVPILMNKNILGGWKYIKPETGEFFTDDCDIVDAYKRLSISNKSPRDWYTQNSGPSISGQRLARFIKSIDPAFTEDFVALAVRANRQ